MAAPQAAFPYPLFDADEHYYEPADAFTRHLEPVYRYAFRWATTEDGRTTLLVGDRVFRMISNPTFDPVAKPGALADYFRGRNQAGNDAKAMIGRMERIRPEYRDRKHRIAVMDRQGVRTALLLPTLALGIEELLHDDPPALHALFRAFNRWIDDDWGYARDGRIVAPPVLCLVDPAAAEAELLRVIERGAKVICLRPAPISTPTGPRSPGDRVHDRFWAIAAEAGVVVALHAADSGYMGHATAWGERWHMQTYTESPFIEILSLQIDRPIFETIAALIAHGVFDRHPALRVATIELGTGWVPELVRRLKIAYGKIPRSFARDPVEAFHDHVWVTPFLEDHIKSLVDAIGAERVLFGSDWPHPEGVAEPADFFADLQALSPADQRRVMSDNLRELLGAA